MPTVNNDPKVVINLSQLKSLLKRDAQLGMLEAGGVGDWEWCEDALQGLEVVEESIDSADYSSIITSEKQ